jgi:hypothetical protein
VTGFSILLLGFLLGMKHATESDHVAAVATLATRVGSVAQTVRQGIAWGIGHTLTLTVIGAAMLLVGRTIRADIAQLLELGVAVMLIGLGIDVLHRLLKRRVHFHVHTHAGGVRHLHAHSHAELPRVGLLNRPRPHRHAHDGPLPVRALAIGIMHGMAGSAALVLLSLEAVNSFPMGIGYILLFGAGSIAGMAILSVAIAIPLRFSARGMTRLHRGLTLLAGGFSVCLGLYMVYAIGIAGGLLISA